VIRALRASHYVVRPNAEHQFGESRLMRQVAERDGRTKQPLDPKKMSPKINRLPQSSQCGKLW